MTCEDVRAEIVAVQRGEADEATAQAVQKHLDTCNACQSLSQSYSESFHLLHQAPAALPSADCFNALLSRLQVPVGAGAAAAPRSMRRPRKSWWRGSHGRIAIALSTAATLLLGIGYPLLRRITTLSATPPAARVLSHQPGSAGPSFCKSSTDAPEERPIAPGTEILPDEVVQTDAGAATVLEMPEVGLLRMTGFGRCRFAGARSVFLDEGDLAADILPKGREFAIETASGTVSVTGTRFRVRATAHGTVVTVSEGSVRLRNGFGTTAVDAGRRAVATRAAAPTPATGVDPAAALNAEERRALCREPRLEFTLDRTSCPPHSSLPARIRLIDTNATLWVDPLLDPSAYYMLNVARPDGTSFQVRLNAYKATEIGSYARHQGRILLHQDQTYEAECLLTDLLTLPGRYTLTASYASSRPDSETDDIWRGIVTSAPAELEVAR